MALEDPRLLRRRRRLLLPVLFIATALRFCSAASSPILRQQQQQPPDGVTLNLWCVAKNNAEDSALQSALDWACGTGGANCTSIQQGGPCYDSSDIRRTASYAFNDYCTKNGMTDDTCNFANTAALTSIDPSHGNCKFPSSLQGKNIQGITTTTGGGGASTADLTSNGDVASGLWPLITFQILCLFLVYYIPF